METITTDTAGLKEAKALLSHYTRAGELGLKNEQLYAALPQFESKVRQVGQQARVDVAKRGVRWQQQTLKALGLLEKVPGQRGKWRCKTNGKELDKAEPGRLLVAFSTRLGIAVYADCRSLFAAINEPIHVVITSPPFPLARPRAYGNPSAVEFVDFITATLEPLVKSLVKGGSLGINLSNDIFEPGSPARSLYLERTIIALHDRLGLHLMDRLIWQNRCKAPGPVLWSSKTRQQLNVEYEFVLWFTNSPHHCFADNRRVLKPHSAATQKLIAKGGESRTAINSDGAYRIKPGSYGRPTAGTIPRNVLSFPSNEGNSHANRAFAKNVADAGLPKHGAPMPLALARFLIQFMAPPPDSQDTLPLIVDPFGGFGTTALAAEELDMRWLIAESAAQYSAASAFRFKHMDGFEQHFALN